MISYGRTRRIRARWLTLGVAAMAMSGCSGAAQQSPASASARAACREHADNVFEQQNRDAVYRSDTYSTDLRDAPFGSSGMPGVPTFGLSQQFGVQTTMQNCLNGTGDQPAATDQNLAAPPVASNNTPARTPAPK